MLFGFVAGRRTHDITSGLKRVVQHATEWRKESCMHMASLGVYRALDNVQVTDVVGSLLELRFPVQLVYALVEGLAQNRADLSFQQVDVPDIAWNSCIRTGSVEAPLFWLCESVVMFRSVVLSWQHRRMGVHLTAQAGSRHLTHAIWADNILLCARDQDELATMIAEASVPLYQGNYRWKPS
eukprot:7298374-Pyramimonas_sp.AAC.1